MCSEGRGEEGRADGRGVDGLPVAGGEGVLLDDDRHRVGHAVVGEKVQLRVVPHRAEDVVRHQRHALVRTTGPGLLLASAHDQRVPHEIAREAERQLRSRRRRPRQHRVTY